MLPFYKKLLLEIVLFATMVTLAGHVTVNFWERYVVQNKISDMKNSLDHLKITVDNMGYAYDDLQRDLLDIAKGNLKLSNSVYASLIRESNNKINRPDNIILDHLNVVLTKVNNKARFLIDKNSGQLSENGVAKNATVNMVSVSALNPVPGGNPRKDKCIYNCRTSNDIRTCKKDCKKIPIVKDTNTLFKRCDVPRNYVLNNVLLCNSVIIIFHCLLYIADVIYLTAYVLITNRYFRQ